MAASFEVRKALRDRMIEELQKGVCTVVFTKSDGSERIMHATLQESFLPPPAPVKEGAKPREPNFEIVNVWDTDESGWRSFRLDRLIEFAFPLSEGVNDKLELNFGDSVDA
jgi:hypothetical protein